MNRSVWKAAFLATLPVLAGYSAMGCAFGILLDANAGLGAGWSFLMSLTILSGSLQFAAVEILNANFPLYKVALLTFFINIRYAMYGFSLIERFRDAGWKKLYMIFALTDETYALQVENKTPDPNRSNDYCFAVALLNQCYWIFGCLLGSVAGRWMDFNKKGIDFAMTALFLVILTEQCLEKRNRLPSLIGGAATLLCRILFGADRMLIPAMVLMLTGFLILRRRLEDGETKEARE